jgi:ribonuclease HII
MQKLPDFDVAMCGKIGGTKYYRPLLEDFYTKVDAIQEQRSISSYRIADGREVHFILNGDDKFLPIAMASVIGKYIRELFMLQINRKFGHDEPIPWASGYRHDGKTFQLLQQMKESYEKRDVEREK